MKLLMEEIENIDIVKPTTKSSCYKVMGNFIQSGIINGNKRLYPYKNIYQNVENYITEMVCKNRAVGELTHPKTPEINLKDVSHKITSLVPEMISESRGICNWKGVATILNTPNGKIVSALLAEDVQLGFSTRALGSVVLYEHKGYKEVQNDFDLKTAADIVYNQSAPDAFLTALMESKEWIYDEQGILREMIAEDIKNEIKTKSSKHVNANVLNYFQKYLQSL